MANDYVYFKLLVDDYENISTDLRPWSLLSQSL